MQQKQVKYVFVGVGLWIFLNIILAVYFHVNASTECAKRAAEVSTGNKFWDSNCLCWVSINVDTKQMCSNIFREAEKVNGATNSVFFNLGLWGSLGILGIAAITHSFQKRAEKQDRSHSEIIDTVKKQNKVEIYMGDVYKEIVNSTVIVRSKVESAFNRLQSSEDTETAKLLIAIGTQVKNANNVAAGVLYSQMADEVSKKNYNKEDVKSYWDGIVTIVPPLSNLSTEVIKLFLS